MSKSIEYRVGIPESSRRRAAELYEEAFRQKFFPVAKSKEKMVEILTESIKPEYAVAAFEGDRLVGLAGFHHEGDYFTSGGSTYGLIKLLGLFRGLWAVFIFGILYERKAELGELLMDGIAVDSSMRGKGIGSGILKKLSEFGAEKGYGKIGLDVIDINDRAKKLYESQGFKATKTDRYPYLGRYIGFASSTTMVKILI